jgi:predicted phosphodiesterase
VRFALLSDVHGNLAALHAVAAALAYERPLDHVVVAGDLLQGGPRPCEVWQALGELGWTLIRGNHDEDIAGTRRPTLADGFTAAGLKQLAWTKQVVGPTIQQALGALPFDVRYDTPAGPLLVVHSSPRDTDDRSGGPHNSVEEIAAAYGGTGATAIAYGHWHQSYVRPTPVALLINVASVGLPKHGLPLAGYSLLTASADGWVVEQRQVPFDPREEATAAARSGMPPWHAPPAPGDGRAG